MGLHDRLTKNGDAPHGAEATTEATADPYADLKAAVHAACIAKLGHELFREDPAALGATWQEANRSMTSGKAGMYLIRSFLAQDITDKDVLADVDFFPFPAIAVEGTDAIEAPIDGFVLSKQGGRNQAAKDMLAFFGTGAGQDAYAAKDSSNLQTAKDADTSAFSALNKKGAEAIGKAKYISQFFDRDALPAMANNVMIPALQGFLKDGTIDTRNLEAQAKTLYAAQ